MSRHLYHSLLGAIAGLIVGFIPSLILLAILDNDAYGIGVLTGSVLVGATLGVVQYEKIDIFFDGLFELITIG